VADHGDNRPLSKNSALKQSRSCFQASPRRQYRRRRCPGLSVGRYSQILIYSLTPYGSQLGLSHPEPLNTGDSCRFAYDLAAWHKILPSRQSDEIEVRVQLALAATRTGQLGQPEIDLAIPSLA